MEVHEEIPGVSVDHMHKKVYSDRCKMFTLSGSPKKCCSFCNTANKRVRNAIQAKRNKSTSPFKPRIRCNKIELTDQIKYKQDKIESLSGELNKCQALIRKNKSFLDVINKSKSNGKFGKLLMYILTKHNQIIKYCSKNAGILDFILDQIKCICHKHSKSLNGTLFPR